MGNCVQSGSTGGCQCRGAGGEGRRPVQLQRGRNQEGEIIMEEHGVASPSPAVKVKMVLTKGELEGLVARLKAGDRRLEDVLHEMARRKREARNGWRPGLESIVECPAETTAATASSDC